jgi:hypothetical protein
MTNLILLQDKAIRESQTLINERYRALYKEPSDTALRAELSKNYLSELEMFSQVLGLAQPLELLMRGLVTSFEELIDLYNEREESNPFFMLEADQVLRMEAYPKLGHDINLEPTQGSKYGIETQVFKEEPENNVFCIFLGKELGND